MSPKLLILLLVGDELAPLQSESETHHAEIPKKPSHAYQHSQYGKCRSYPLASGFIQSSNLTKETNDPSAECENYDIGHFLSWYDAEGHCPMRRRDYVVFGLSVSRNLSRPGAENPRQLVAASISDVQSMTPII
jgi:hypothetical protein